MTTEELNAMFDSHRTLTEGLARGRAMVAAAELLREAAIGHEVNPTTPQAEARRERILAKMLILLSLLRLGRFGRQRRALQRALGVSDDVLREVQEGMVEQVAWGIKQA